MIASANKGAAEHKARYIWKVGILRWALPLYLLFMVMESFVLRRHNAFTLSNLAEVGLFALVVWLITGWIFGFIMWRRRQSLSRKQRP